MNPEKFLIFSLPKAADCLEILLCVPGAILENADRETLVHFPKASMMSVPECKKIIREKTGYEAVWKSNGYPCPKEID